MHYLFNFSTSVVCIRDSLYTSWFVYFSLLISADGLAAFRTFLKSEFSDENIEFWLACEDFKKTKSAAKIASKAHKIYSEFIQADSPKEVTHKCVFLEKGVSTAILKFGVLYWTECVYLLCACEWWRVKNQYILTFMQSEAMHSGKWDSHMTILGSLVHLTLEVSLLTSSPRSQAEILP